MGVNVALLNRDPRPLSGIEWDDLTIIAIGAGVGASLGAFAAIIPAYVMDEWRLVPKMATIGAFAGAFLSLCPAMAD